MKNNRFKKIKNKTYRRTLTNREKGHQGGDAGSGGIGGIGGFGGSILQNTIVHKLGESGIRGSNGSHGRPGFIGKEGLCETQTIKYIQGSWCMWTSCTFDYYTEYSESYSEFEDADKTVIKIRGLYFENLNNNDLHIECKSLFKKKISG